MPININLAFLEELLQASHRHAQITPMQIEILFDLCTAPYPGKGSVFFYLLLQIL